MVLSEPTTQQIVVHCDALPEKCFGLCVHEGPVCEQGIGIATVGNFHVRDSVCKPFFQANETIDGEFASASRLFDLLRVCDK